MQRFNPRPLSYDPPLLATSPPLPKMIFPEKSTEMYASNSSVLGQGKHLANSAG